MPPDGAYSPRSRSTSPVRGLGTDKPTAYDEVVTRAGKEKGDAVLGSRLFLKQNCIACHTVSKDEPVKGPFLGDIANRYSRAELPGRILAELDKLAASE